MELVLWYVLPLAVAVALSIFPVLAVVLLLLSENPARSSLAYAVGWSLGVVALVSVFTAAARLIPSNLSDYIPPWVHYFEIIIGLALVIDGTLSAVRGRHRAKIADPPKWLSVANNLGTRQAFAFGLLMNVRPKNLALTLAAGLAIGTASITPLAAGVSLILFAVIGVSTVAGLVLAYVLGPKRMQPVLTFLNDWLVSHASLVLKLSIIVIGALLIAVGVFSLVTAS